MKFALDVKLLKRRIMRVFFALEVAVFAGFYLFGGNGIHYLAQLESENNELDAQLVHIRREVALLNEQIAQWQADPFFKEKIAREQLQMAREGDEIYYIG